MRLRKLEPSGAKGDSRLSTEVECRGHARVGVLFSGGLDSAVIAALAREALPPEEPLDLINVAVPIRGSLEYFGISVVSFLRSVKQMKEVWLGRMVLRGT